MPLQAVVIRVLCVDDHPLVRKGIAAILANEPNITIVGEADNGHDALQRYRELEPDVVLMDLRMRGWDGIETVRAIRTEFPDARIIALTSFDGDHDIYRALEAGVRGYLLKETAHLDIVQAIVAVHAGRRMMAPGVVERISEYFPGVALTLRETEVLELVAQGYGNKDIAQQLGTASGTAKLHVQHVIEKLGASDRTHAVAIAVRRGILNLA
jgi:DNA-binding NarL/FixJ family response regulator